MSGKVMSGTALTAATKAACQVRIDDYRRSGVRSISLTADCRYPACTCKILPAQIKAAIEAHQTIELARWRAEVAQMREPPEDDPVPGIPVDTNLGV